MRCSVSWGSARTQCNPLPAPRSQAHPTYTMLQSVAECCRVLQCVAGRCSVSWGSARTQCDPHPAPRTSTHPTHTVFQCVAVCCSVLQCVAVSAGVLPDLTAILTGSSNINTSYSCCSVLQCAAVCCSVLQCVAVRCRVNLHVRGDACTSEPDATHTLMNKNTRLIPT